MTRFRCPHAAIVFCLIALQAFAAAAQTTSVVTYNGNGSTGGSVPVDPGTYAQGAPVTVLGNSGALTRPNRQFAGWNSTATGSGTSYAAGGTFAMGSANVTLYAQWMISCLPGFQNPDCTPQTPITVQVINDSGVPDSEVMLLLSGKDLVISNSDGTQSFYPFTVSGVANVNISGASPAATPSSPLLCQPVTASCPGLALATTASGALTVNSPYSGKQNLPVYQFTMSTVASGTLFVSNPAPNWPNGVVTPPTPTATSPLRFQPLEFSYANGIVSNGDLTAIDFFGIPFELQTYAQGDSTFRSPLDRVTYYTSTPSLLSAFTAVNASLSSAFVRTDGMSYDALNPMHNFARIIGPNQAAAATSAITYPATAPAGWPSGRAWPPAQGTGSPWPYPSFASYLDWLATHNYTFIEQDNAPISGFQFLYTGSVTKMYALDPATQKPTAASCLDPTLAVDGWLIMLKGTTTSSTGPLPANADICIPMPAKGSVATGNQYASGDFVIYGAPQNCQTMGLASGGVMYACNANNVADFTNSLYGWIQADVLAALSFGYMGGQLDAANGGQGRSSDWYGLPPVAYPFGAARSTNDGRYNIWAALMYNNSDAYGFAFSDRNGRPSPDIAFPIGGTLRLWILPDQRLDAPMVQVMAAGESSVTLSWPKVNAADHYVVTWSPPYQAASTTVAQPPGSGPVTQVIAVPAGGTTYTLGVSAVNADSSQRSATLPVHATTQGPQPKAAPGNGVFNFSLDWTLPATLSGVPDLLVAGIPAAYTTAAQGIVSYSIPGLPITVGPPAASAPLTVVPSPSYNAVSLAASIVPMTINPGGIATLTVTLNNPTAIPVPLPRGFTVPVPTGVSVTLPAPGVNACPGAVVNPGTSVSTIAIGATPLAANSSCTIVASLSSSTPGTILVATPDLQNGPAANPVTLALSVSAPLTVSGGAVAAIAQSIVPGSIAAGGNAVLTINLANTTNAALTLQQKFVDELPLGVTVVSLQPGTPPCAGVGVDATATLIAMPAGSTIPPNGCAIVATITSSTPGSVTNTTSPLLTNATVYPIQSYPLELRRSKSDLKAPGARLWGANLYLTFLGTAWEYSVGPCLPTDECMGGQATPAPGTVAFNTAQAPNFLERQSAGAGLSIAGGTMSIGPPFGTAVPNVGVSFTPAADKQVAPVYYPAPISSLRPPPRTGTLMARE